MGFGLEVSPSHWYGGNAAYFQIGMLTYNLMNWFKELALGQNQKKAMIKWIRNHFLLIVGKLVQTGRCLKLKLSQNYPFCRLPLPEPGPAGNAGRPQSCGVAPPASEEGLTRAGTGPGRSNSTPYSCAVVPGRRRRKACRTFGLSHRHCL